MNVSNMTDSTFTAETADVVIVYEPYYLILSICISVMGSFTTLQMLLQVRLSNKRLAILFWLFSGAMALATCAVWSMHFLGMNAVSFILRHKTTGATQMLGMSFDILRTIMSLAIALACFLLANLCCGISYLMNPTNKAKPNHEENELSGAVPLYESTDLDVRARQYRQRQYLNNHDAHEVVSHIGEIIKENIKAKESKIKELFKQLTIDNRRPKVWQLLIGGLMIASGACGMHYLGMHAMVMQADFIWNPYLVTLSVVIALVAGTVGLFLCFYVSGQWIQVVCSFIIAVAVCAMHYTGMGALTFQYNPNLAAVDMKDQIPMSTLVLIITLITVLICFILTVIVTFSLERERKTLFKRLDSEYEKLQVETDKSDKLLLNILPPHVTDRIKGGEQVCDKFTSTIIFSDICGFTSMSHSMHPEEIVEMLNELFTDFDEALSIYGIEKIKTIGDAYMAVAGLNNEDDHAQRCLEFGIQMIHSVKMYNARKNRNLRIRIGLNSGDVVAGVIGSKKFTYDIWGDSVNVASRMESLSEPMGIMVSESTYNELHTKYSFKKRERISVKGKGEMNAYMLDLTVLEMYDNVSSDAVTGKETIGEQ